MTSKQCRLCGTTFSTYSQFYTHKPACETEDERPTEEELHGKVPVEIQALEVLLLESCTAYRTSIFDLVRISASCRYLNKLASKSMDQKFWERVCLHMRDAQFKVSCAGRNVHIHADGIHSGGDWKRAFIQEVKALKRISWNLETIEDQMARGCVEAQPPKPLGRQPDTFYIKSWKFSEYKVMNHVKRLNRNGVITLNSNSEATFTESFSFGQKFRWTSYNLEAKGTWCLTDDGVEIQLKYKKQHTEPKTEESSGNSKVVIPYASFSREDDSLVDSSFEMVYL